jgi:benzodiazapine receptor
MKSVLQLLCVASLATSAIGAAGAGSPLSVSQTVLQKSPKGAATRTARTTRNQNNKQTTTIISSSTQNVASIDNSALLETRGGACSDSSPALFFKIGLSAALETAIMVGLLLVASKHSTGTSTMDASKFQFLLLPNFFGLPLSSWLAVGSIIYGSSVFGSLVDGSLSAATQQALDPNTTPGDPEWYAKLQKPSWTPPGWVFPIMWLLIAKPTQLLAVTRLLKVVLSAPQQVLPLVAQNAADTASSTMMGAPAGATVAGPRSSLLPVPLELILTVYCAHLSLGDAWNKVFFGLQCPGRGAAVITVFFGLLLASAYLFGMVDPLAGKLLLPTCAWVLVASALNWNIYLNNKATTK